MLLKLPYLSAKWTNFLIKYDKNGKRIWSTFYSGMGIYWSSNYWDCIPSIATDGKGYVYLGGSTTDTAGIATTGAHQNIYGGNADAFLVKFDSSGKRQWSTYYGGQDFDVTTSIVVDNNNNVIISGYTGSTSGIAAALTRA